MGMMQFLAKKEKEKGKLKINNEQTMLLVQAVLHYCATVHRTADFKRKMVCFNYCLDRKKDLFLLKKSLLNKGVEAILAITLY